MSKSNGKPSIVHLGSRFEVRLGYLDDDGNAIPQEPFVLTISAITDSTFDEIQKQINDRREKLAEAIAQSLAEKKS
jgi:hypothetical protein